MSEFKHPLAQNDEQWEGYTVFPLQFNGVPIKFVTLVDAKHVLESRLAAAESERDEARELTGKAKDSFAHTVLESYQWAEWEKEQARRMEDNAENADKPNQLETFDVSESRECGWISPKHFNAFMFWWKQFDVDGDGRRGE